MKSKYYPLVTIVGASLVAGLPVFILWSSLSSEDGRPLAATAAPSASPGITSQEVSAASSIAPVRPPRIAMSSTPTLNLPIGPLGTDAGHADTIDRPELALSPDPVVGIVPAPIDVAETRVPEIAEPLDEWESVEPGIMPEVPQRPIVSDSYYDATGHLALSSQALVPDPAMISSATDVTEPAVEKASVKKSSDGRRTRKQKKDEATTVPVDPQNPAHKTAGSQLPEGPIEDVAIQTPLETQPVGRVENVVALTRAKGWPVALIKSDLPDDVWWVQQMVGIQGTSFNARVNFGNEYSISGTQYHMVIVFLDSPDEVRRFRIAKQFKDVPAGVRRSREFHYIRN